MHRILPQARLQPHLSRTASWREGSPAVLLTVLPAFWKTCRGVAVKKCGISSGDTGRADLQVLPGASRTGNPAVDRRMRMMLFGLRGIFDSPHRVGRFKFSNDPEFASKVRWTAHNPFCRYAPPARTTDARIERSSAEITRKQIRRGSFQSVRALTSAIDNQAGVELNEERVI